MSINFLNPGFIPYFYPPPPPMYYPNQPIYGYGIILLSEEEMFQHLRQVLQKSEDLILEVCMDTPDSQIFNSNDNPTPPPPPAGSTPSDDEVCNNHRFSYR